MLLRAGLLSLSLLLASRILGLVRESAQAAAFGATGLGDVVVLMLTLPDWVAGVFASGALAYVLLPHWARQDPPEQARTQRTVAWVLLVVGVVLGAALVLVPDPFLTWMAGGVPLALRPLAEQALLWSALALPMALLAALWSTRLQHERDFAGMYGSNLVVNAVLITAMLAVALESVFALGFSGFCLVFLLAMVLRLVWQAWRLRVLRGGAGGTDDTPSARAGDANALTAPSATLWIWAALAAGLPLALPFAARSWASQGGEGGLVTFNYAWKLIELPLVLAIQLVATLAFPSITRAFAAPTAAGSVSLEADAAVRGAMALAWTLACAAAAGLLLSASAVSSLLFGWGRMDGQALSRVAQWGASGAWGLLPQAVSAVALTVLAVQGRMRPAALAYGGVLLAIVMGGEWAAGDGLRLMLLLNLGFAVVAVVAVLSLGRSAWRWLPLRLMAATAVTLAGLAAVGDRIVVHGTLAGLGVAVTGALAIGAVGLLSGPDLARALRR